MKHLPSSHSDYAISWIIEDPHNHFFNFTGESDELFILRKENNVLNYQI